MSKQSFKLISFAFIAVVAILIFNRINAQSDVNEVKKALTEGAFLVDVRTPQEFSEGSVKGAVNIPLNAIESYLNEFKNKKNIVVFCRSGQRSGSAKSILEQKGFKNVINGGSWQNVNQIIESKKQK